MKNYYFKFGPGNNFFNHYLKRGIINDINLAIFFGTEWDVKMWNDSPDQVKYFNNKHGDFQQIENFMRCQRNDSFFWIFNKGIIYLFKPLENSHPWTGKEGYFNNRKISGDVYPTSTPKFLKFELIRTFEGNKLPESFSTLNANQKYNRKTIKEIYPESIEGEIANYLVSEQHPPKKMEIKNDRRLDYLSPIQFETLIFIIFHHNNCFVSTFRGGTRKDIDLVIEPYDNFDIFNQKKKYTLQIKKYDYLNQHPRWSLTGENYLIHLGNTISEKNILGKDWIIENLNGNIDKWLNKTLDFFKIVD